MSALQAPVHPVPSLAERTRQLGRTVRWAPAPRWGTTPAQHRWFVVYLGGSMLAWTLAGLAMSALLGRALGLVG